MKKHTSITSQQKREIAQEVYQDCLDLGRTSAQARTSRRIAYRAMNLSALREFHEWTKDNLNLDPGKRRKLLRMVKQAMKW